MSTYECKHVPEFIMPASIENIEEEEYLQFLEAMRIRRLVVREVQKGKVRDKTRAPKATREKLDKQYEMLAKEVERFDKLLEKLDTRLKNILQLRIEVGGVYEAASFPTEDNINTDTD